MNKHKKTKEEEETNLSLLAMKLLNLPPQILRGLGELDGGHDGVVLLLRAQLAVADASVVGCDGAARVTTAMVGMSSKSKLETLPRSDISWHSLFVFTLKPELWPYYEQGCCFLSFFLSSFPIFLYEKFCNFFQNHNKNQSILQQNLFYKSNLTNFKLTKKFVPKITNYKCNHWKGFSLTIERVRVMTNGKEWE